MGTIITAKVFKSGNSQALRLPRALKLKAKSYHITPTDGGFQATDPAAEARRLKALRKLWGSCPDFPDHTT
jgi:virulence-associated protein VagC